MLSMSRSPGPRSDQCCRCPGVLGQDPRGASEKKSPLRGQTNPRSSSPESFSTRARASGARPASMSGPVKKLAVRVPSGGATRGARRVSSRPRARFAPAPPAAPPDGPEPPPHFSRERLLFRARRRRRAASSTPCSRWRRGRSRAPRPARSGRRSPSARTSTESSPRRTSPDRTPAPRIQSRDWKPCPADERGDRADRRSALTTRVDDETRSLFFSSPTSTPPLPLPADPTDPPPPLPPPLSPSVPNPPR